MHIKCSIIFHQSACVTHSTRQRAKRYVMVRGLALSRCPTLSFNRAMYVCVLCVYDILPGVIVMSLVVRRFISQRPRRRCLSCANAVKITHTKAKTERPKESLDYYHYYDEWILRTTTYNYMMQLAGWTEFKHIFFRNAPTTEFIMWR